jgi:LacI family transcriptional regulator
MKVWRKGMVRKTPLPGGKVHRVVILLDISFSFARQALRGINQYCRTNMPRWTLFPLLHGARYPMLLDEVRPDAILAGFLVDPVLRFVRSRRIPLVSISSSRLDIPAVFVIPDNVEAGRVAAEHFLERGYRSFGYMGLSWADFSRLRRSGFQQRVLEAGGECREFISPRVHMVDGIPVDDMEGFDDWIRAIPKPAGILAVDEGRAWELVLHCLALGVRIPDEIAVLSCGEDDLVCESVDVPISGLDMRFQTIGFEAARVLDRLLRGHPPPREPVLIPPGKVTVRQSTDIFAIGDANLSAAVRFVREHACEKIGVEDILREVPVGRRWLERRYRRLLGRSIYADINHQRIQRAKAMLDGSNQKISEISLRCGFEHPQHFGATFRRITGQTPAQYRRGHKAE